MMKNLAINQIKYSMKLFFLLCTLSISCFVHSQNVIKWCYQNDNDFYGISYDYSYLEGSLITDSISESNYYSIDYEENSYLSANVKSDSTGKVFVTFPVMGIEAPEILLYDFSLEIGDTMHYYYGGLPDGYIIDQYHYKVVTETDSIFIDGLKRKTLTLLSCEDILCYESYEHYWIEGYGSCISRGFLNPLETDMILNGDNYSFSCLQENDVSLLMDTCICDIADDISEREKENMQIDVIDKGILINGTAKCCLQLFDLSGKLHMNATFEGKKILHFENLTNGMYILKVSGNNFNIVKKIIID